MENSVFSWGSLGFWSLYISVSKVIVMLIMSNNYHILSAYCIFENYYDVLLKQGDWLISLNTEETDTQYSWEIFPKPHKAEEVETWFELKSVWFRSLCSSYQKPVYHILV